MAVILLCLMIPQGSAFTRVPESCVAAVGEAWAGILCHGTPLCGFSPRRISRAAYVAPPRKEDHPEVTYHHFLPRPESRKGTRPSQGTAACFLWGMAVSRAVLNTRHQLLLLVAGPGFCAAIHGMVASGGTCPGLATNLPVTASVISKIGS